MNNFYYKLNPLIIAGLLFAALPVKLSYSGEVNLRIQHPLGENSTLHREVLLPWVQRLSRESQGRIDAAVIPAMRLGGSPLDLYSQVKNGTIDIAWLPVDYVKDKFTRARVFELPTVHKGSALATSRAMYDMRNELESDFPDVQLLLLYADMGNLLHVRGSIVDSPQKLSGYKIRGFSVASDWLIEAWGGEISKIPSISVPDALYNNELQATLLPYRFAIPYRIEKTVNFSHIGIDGERFGTSVYALIMNKDLFNRIDSELARIIETSTGINMITNITQLIERDEALARTQLADARVGLIRLTSRRMATFAKASQGAVDKWLEEAGNKEIDGITLLDSARNAVERNSGGL